MANAGAKLSSFPEVNDIQTGDMFPLLSGGNTNAKIDYATLADAIIAKLKSETGDSVLSINGKTGAVTLSKADVGLGNVDNTSDADKPISTAVQEALDGKANNAVSEIINDHINNKNNPHVVTKAQVGLGSVANLDQSKAIKSITRSGTTFTATALDGTTTTFTQQDSTTTYGIATSSTDGLMSAVDKTKLDGVVDQASQLAKNTAQIESAGTATNAHSVDEYVMISNALYKVTASVAKGDTWTIGTNVTAANIGSEIGSLKSDLANKLYPVGSIYMSVNATNPAELFGGTWEQIKGRFLIGAGANDANTTDYWGHEDANHYNIPAGELGGSASHSHILGGNAAACIGNYYNVTAFSSNYRYHWKDYPSSLYGWTHNADSQINSSTDHYNDGSFVELTGSTDMTNSMPPYLAVYMWKRTA